jgi:hypothetical protein
MINPKEIIGNFTLGEVIFCPIEELPENLLPCAYILAGYLNMTRNFLRARMGDVYMATTSGYRNAVRNKRAGGAATSLHMWRFEKGQWLMASDFKVFRKTKTRPADITREAWNILKELPTFVGELGYKKSDNIIHMGVNSNKVVAPFEY